MPRTRRTSGSLGRTRLRATCWPIALQRRSSIGARRARRACLVPQLEEEGLSMDLLMSNRPSTLGFLAALMLSLSASGEFGQTHGKSQPIAFIATDLVNVETRRITH